MIWIIFLVIRVRGCGMQPALKLEQRQIKNKLFLVPQYNLYGCEKYMLPKLQNAPVHHTFFSPQELQDFYKQKNIDISELNHNLDKQVGTDQESMLVKSKPEDSSVEEQQSIEQESSRRKRPSLRAEGFTHFINIPFVEALRDIYENRVVPQIEEQDRDLLQALQSMHLTVMAFRLKSETDLPKWEQVLKAVRKTKVSIRGVDFFAVKKQFGRVLYFNVKGVDSLIDSVVSRAVQMGLVEEQELGHIKFDKISQTYKAHPHITLLKANEGDLFDCSDYINKFNKINLTKINVSEIRISVIGSFDGSDYYHQSVLQL